MKKYFVKYLFVEGEIKEGDYFKTTEGALLKCSGREGEIVYGPKNGFIGTFAKEQYTPYKMGNSGYYRNQILFIHNLFLCSRDIQVGERMYCETTRRYGKAATVKRDKKNVITYISILYEDKPEQKTGWGIFPDTALKVIGEIITPGIKEGQEYNENQVKVIDCGHHVECCDYELSLCPVKKYYGEKSFNGGLYVEIIGEVNT